VNAKRGGTLLVRYLDPPRMDLSRTNSCTIYHTLSYTTNKLTVAKMGANADPFLVDIEPDLAESWEMSDGGATHTFNLRKGVKFHNKAPVNGREFVAQDIVNTVRLYSGDRRRTSSRWSTASRRRTTTRWCSSWTSRWRTSR
jgi:ABC-type transport system substrate-binding protein